MQNQKKPIPYFVIWLLLVMAILLFFLLRYASGTLFAKEPPTITISGGGQELSWVVAKNQWNGSVYDREPTFVCYERAGLLPSQLERDASITVTMGGSIPDKVTLREYSLAPSEASAFGSIQHLSDIIFYFNGKSGSFTLPQSDTSPLRGYLLTCTWGQNTCEYGFVVQVLPKA